MCVYAIRHLGCQQLKGIYSYSIMRGHAWEALMSFKRTLCLLNSCPVHFYVPSGALNPCFKAYKSFQECQGLDCQQLMQGYI